jgi:16S rRNA (cytidine1402-2'-O)-methyltransferase
MFILMTTLYLVPTPLGDPDDITLRALRILREVSAIAVPNYPQQILKLLEGWEIPTQTIPYSDVVGALNAGDVALVANSGTPGIDGKTHAVVREALEQGIKVEPLPGASAEITALVQSGLPTDSFVYFDRMPDDLSTIADERDTMIMRAFGLGPELERLWRAGWGKRAICVVVAPTTSHEIIYRGIIDGAVEYFMDVMIIDGMLVVAGAPPKAAEVWDEARVRAELSDRMRAGEPLKLAAKAVAAVAGWDRREVYALGVDEKRNTP